MSIALSAVILALMLAVPAAWVVTALGTARGSHRWRLHDRADVVTRLATCLAFLALGRVLAPWQSVPAAAWGLAVALTVFAALTSAYAVRGLPWTKPGKRSSPRLAGAAVNAVIGIAIVVLTLP